MLLAVLSAGIGGEKGPVIPRDSDWTGPEGSAGGPADSSSPGQTKLLGMTGLRSDEAPRNDSGRDGPLRVVRYGWKRRRPKQWGRWKLSASTGDQDAQ